MRKKILAFLLTGCMVFQSIGMPVYAEETHQDPSAVKQEEEIARPSLQSIESAGVEAVSGSEETDVEDIAQEETSGSADQEGAEKVETESCEESGEMIEDAADVQPAETQIGEEVLESETGTEENKTGMTDAEENVSQDQVDDGGQRIVELPGIASVDPVADAYVWENVTVTPKSYAGLFGFELRQWPDGKYFIMTTTDPEKDFSEDAAYLTASEYFFMKESGYRSSQVDIMPFDNNGNIVGSVVLEGLAPQTTYYYRVLRYDSGDAGDRYYFLTERSEFTTLEKITESRVAITDVKLVETGLAGATISFDLDNPEDEFFETVAVHRPDGEIQYCAHRRSGTVEVNVPFVKEGENIYTPFVLITDGDGEEREKEGASITVTAAAQKAEGTVNVAAAGNTAALSIKLQGFAACDRELINAAAYYREVGNQDWQCAYPDYGFKRDADGTITNSIVISGLKENAEYEYYVEVAPSWMYEWKLFVTEPEQFQIGETELLTEEDIPDETLRSALQAEVGQDVLTTANLAQITSFMYSNAREPIHDLKGIEYLTGVADLIFYGQEFQTAEEVTQLTQLKSLAMTNGDLKKMPDLSRMENLTDIYMNGNLLPASEITADKLPAGFVQKNPAWIEDTIGYQRRAFQVRTAGEYYETGDGVWPFIIAISGIKVDQNYTLSVTVDGITGESTKFLEPYYNNDVYMVLQHLQIDVESGPEKEVSYRLTGEDGVVYAEETVTCRFTEGKFNSRAYIRSGDSYFLHTLRISKAQRDELGEPVRAELIDKQGKLFGTADSVVETEITRESRYDDIFPGAELEISDEGKLLDFRIWLSEYPEEGVYDIRIVGESGNSVVISDVVEVSDSCLITGLSINTTWDIGGDYVYFQMEGINIDPQRIHPDIKGTDGSNILEYVGFVKEHPDYQQGTRIVYRYKKIGAVWNNDGVSEVSVKWELVSDGDCIYEDIAKSHETSLAFRNTWTQMYYNYKNDMLVLNTSASVADGTHFEVHLAEFYGWDGDVEPETGNPAAGQGTVKDGSVMIHLLDESGNNYIPQRGIQYWIRIIIDGDTENASHLLSYINFYNVGDALTFGKLEIMAIRLTDMQFHVKGDVLAEEGAIMTLELQKNGEAVEEPRQVAVSSGGKLDYIWKLEHPLEEGAYSVLAYREDEVDQLSASLAVYDENIFYTDEQSGAAVGNVLQLKFTTLQNYGEANREDGIALFEPDAYEIVVYDRNGNELRRMHPDSVKPDPEDAFTLVLEADGMPEGEYAGFYVKLTRSGLLPVTLWEPSRTYYESGEEENSLFCSARYGLWVMRTSQLKTSYFLADDEEIHGIYGIYGDERAAYPLTVRVMKLGTGRELKAFSISKAGINHFSEADMQGLDNEVVYDLVAVDKNGDALAYRTGYIGYLKPPVVVSSIELNKIRLPLTTQEGSNKELLEASLMPADATAGRGIVWSSSDEQVVTVDRDGLVCAAGSGSAEIKVAAADGAVTASCEVTVYDIDHQELVLNVEDKEKLSVTDGVSSDLKASWSTSDVSVALVDAKGNVEAVGKGEALISAKLPNGLTLNCRLTVKNDLTSISFQKKECVLEVGDEDKPEVVYMPASEAAGCELLWESLDENVITVDECGNVTAVGEGTAEVVVTITAPKTYQGFQARCIYTVVKAPEPIRDDFYVSALVGVVTTLDGIPDELPEGWEWAEPNTALKPFTGMMEKEFAVVHENPYTHRKAYDTVLVSFLTIKDMEIEQVMESGEYTALPDRMSVGDRLAFNTFYRTEGRRTEYTQESFRKTQFILASLSPNGILEFDYSAARAEVVAKKAGKVTMKAMVINKETNAVIASVEYKITVVDSAKTGVADISVSLVDDDGNAVLMNQNGEYEVQTGTELYLKNDTPVNEVQNRPYKISFKTTDALVAKAGKTDKNDSSKTALVTGKPGKAILTAIANDVLKTSLALPIRVVDRTKNGISLSTTSVTVSPLMEKDYAELTVYNGYGAALESVQIVDKKGNAVVDGAYTAEIVDADAGTVRIGLGNAVKSGKIYLKVKTLELEGEEPVFQISIKVNSKKPSVTVKQLKKVNTFLKGEIGQMIVGATGEVIEDVVLEDCGYEYHYADGSLCVKMDGDISDKKGTLKVYLQGYREPVEKVVTVATETTGFGLGSTNGVIYTGSDNTTARTQVINKGTKQPLDLNGAEIYLTDESQKDKFAVRIENNSIFITALQNMTKSVKVNFTVKNPEKWNETRTFGYTVKPVNLSRATLQLGSKTLTLYNYGGAGSNSVGTALTLNGGNDAAELMPKVRIAGVDAKARAILDQTLVIAYDAERGQIRAKINGEGPTDGSYRFNLELKDDSLTKVLKTVLTVKIVNVDLSNAQKMVKVSGKGKLDVLARNSSSLVLTPKFTNVAADAEVVEIKLTGSDAHLFEITGRSGNAVTVKLKEDVSVVTKYDYRLCAVYTIRSGDAEFELESAPIKVKLTQGKVKITVAGASSYSNTLAEGKALTFIVTNSMGEQLAVEDVKLLNYTDDFSYGDGKLFHRLAGETARGKSYGLKFELKLKGRGDNEKATAVTWKVQIVK